MTEEEFLERWTAERPMYEAWGRHVVTAVTAHLDSAIAPLSADIFLRIPPKPRVKGEGSILEKAFHRNKPYEDPYAEITDKVGVRFVVLLSRDLKKVERAILSSADWTFSKDRDFEKEQEKNPLQFEYAAVHYVVRSAKEINAFGCKIAAETPCEVQIKTILQHAYSELTHDTIYKPTVNATHLMKRNAAKSMALIEATNDYFEKVVDLVEAETSKNKTFSEEAAKLYRRYIGTEPEVTRAEGIISEAYEDDVSLETIAKLDVFLSSKDFICNQIRSKASTMLLYRQPSILLIYLVVSEKPTKAKAKWPLTPAELRPVYVDLGKAFDNY